jgi:hypothetical protein
MGGEEAIRYRSFEGEKMRGEGRKAEIRDRKSEIGGWRN